VQLVDEVGDQELGVHLAAALDHQPSTPWAPRSSLILRICTG
jgi:hypothetical protein